MRLANPARQARIAPFIGQETLALGRSINYDAIWYHYPSDNGIALPSQQLLKR